MATTARRRCANCGAPLRARDRFCSSCGTPFDVAVTRPAPAPAAIAPEPSESASLQVPGATPGALGEQRKVVTILFADLSGSTALGERLDPEELRGVLTSYFNELSRQIKRYEGTIDKYVGDAIMAVFGAPISHEDDAERAINAALAMQGSIARLNDDLAQRYGVRLSLRIGINTGEVVAGLLGGDVQRAYTVVGDAVNTAQRYEAAAPPGEILVSATSRRLAIHSFEFEQTAPLTLKGKAERVVAYRVIRRRYEEIAPEASPFIGREAELELLRAAVGDAVEGRGRVVSIIGEAGVGKSRLVGELRAGLVSGIDRITVRCASFEANTPYALIADFVRGAFSIHAADDEQTARNAIANGFNTLAHPLDESVVVLLLDMLGYGQRSTLDPEVKRRVLVNLIRTLLQLASARVPFVLTAEDLHWVDAASLHVLTELVGVIPSLAGLFITTARPGWTPPWPAEPISLRAFEGDDVRTLIEAVFEVPVTDDLAEMLIVRTAGNPFFLEEIIRELQASNLLIENLGRVTLRTDATVRVPETVQEVIEARLDRLEDQTRRTLNTGAVCGRTFWLRVLERLLPGFALPPHLALLERESFITLRAVSPELTYGFRQILIQEVAYETQLVSERRRVHGAIGAAVEALYADRLEEFVDFLAYHYRRSDAPAKGAGYLVRAGERALNLYANEEAIRDFRQALELSRDADLRTSAYEGLGDALATTGDLRGARAAYEEGLAVVKGEVGRARLERKTAFTFMRAAEFDNASAWQQRALATIGDRADAEVAAIWLDIGQVAWRQGRYDEAIVALGNGVGAAKRVGATKLVADCFRQLGTAHVLKGERALGHEHYEHAIEVYSGLNDVFGLMATYNNVGVTYRREDRWDDALRVQERALELARRIGDTWSIGTILGNNGEALRYQGRYDDALVAYEEALRIWAQVGDAAGVALIHMDIGILELERGRKDAARPMLMRSLEEWEKLSSRRFLPELYRALGRVELGTTGGLGWAERALIVAREIKARDEEAMSLQLLGEIHAAAGDPRAAGAELAESVEILRATGDRLELARSLCSLAEVRATQRAPAREIAALAREAAALFAELGSSERVRAEALLAVNVR